MSQVQRMRGDVLQHQLARSQDIIREYRDARNKFNIKLMRVEELMQDVEFRMVSRVYDDEKIPEAASPKMIRKTSLVKIPESIPE